MHPLLVALQFLTRIPVPGTVPPDAEQVRRSLAYYPAVGALVGTLLWLCGALLADLAPLPRAAVLLALWTALTGALHLDGLADSFDASAGGRGDPERARALLKDPRCGPMGVVSIAVVLLLKFAALAELTSAQATWPLVLPPVLARAAVIGLFLTTPYVSPGGLGTHLAAPGYRARDAGSLAIAVLVTWLTAGAIAGAWTLFATAAMLAAVRAWLRTAFGGVTGDGAGALVEISEATLLVVLATVAI